MTVPCDACGREDEWPHPELGCACGTVLRIPVRGARPGGVRRPALTETAPFDEAAPDTDLDETPARSPRTTAAPAARTAEASTPHSAGATTPRAAETAPAPGAGGVPARAVGGPSAGGPAPDDAHHTGAPPSDAKGPATPESPLAPGQSPVPPTVPTPRPAFRPVTIRTARDAVTAAALYLRWLGYRDIRRADQRPPSGIGLAARGVVAQVDPTVRPASLRDVECLWLTAMSESTRCVYFSLAGYSQDARSRADLLGVPLFVLDLTGTPQPVNAPADELTAAGA
ncbi:hypothetical protein [Streptomyces fagopyri]